MYVSHVSHARGRLCARRDLFGNPVILVRVPAVRITAIGGTNYLPAPTHRSRYRRWHPRRNRGPFRRALESTAAKEFTRLILPPCTASAPLADGRKHGFPGARLEVHVDMSSV